MDNDNGLSGFPDLFGKVFLISFKFFWLDFSTVFCEDNRYKASLLISLQYRDITTAIILYNRKSITILLSKQNYAFFVIKKQEKESGKNFILLSWLKNMIGLFIKIYLNSSMNWSPILRSWHFHNTLRN